MRAADHRIVDRGTQWHRLSAAVNNPMDWNAQEGPSSMLWVSADDNIVVTVEGEVVVGRRRRSTPSSWRAQASPTRPAQPSLASVGCGMAAGAAFAHPRAADAPVRPNFFNHM